MDASGNSLELTLAEYAEKPFGNVIFLRHAFAPGFDANGEPDKFEIDDCSTQRNLSEIGRKQAANIGEKILKKELESKQFIQANGAVVWKQQNFSNLVRLSQNHH
jgi:hypothetical protein